MSANYWVSTHRNHWIFPKDELATMRQKLERENSDLVQMFTLPEARHLYIYFNQRKASPTLTCAALAEHLCII